MANDLPDISLQDIMQMIGDRDLIITRQAKLIEQLQAALTEALKNEPAEKIQFPSKVN